MKRCLLFFCTLFLAQLVYAQQSATYTGAVINEVRVIGRDVIIITNVPASRIIDGKKMEKTEKATYKLSFKEHTITLEAEGYHSLTQTIIVAPNGAGAFAFELKPIEIIKKDISVITNVPASRIVDGEDKGVSLSATYNLTEGKHTLIAKANGYQSKTKRISVNSSSPSTYTMKLMPLFNYEWQQFVMFNYAGSNAPQHSFGFSYGQVKRWGWYANVMIGTGFHYKAIDEAELPYFSKFTGRHSQNRLSFTGGGLFRFIPWLSVYAGAGYGYRSLTWETQSGWVRIDTNASPLHGISLETGLIVSLKGIILSAGISSIASGNGGFVEGKVGIGYIFKR